MYNKVCHSYDSLNVRTLRSVDRTFVEKNLSSFKIIFIKEFVVVHNTLIWLEYVQPQTHEPYK